MLTTPTPADMPRRRPTHGSWPPSTPDAAPLPRATPGVTPTAPDPTPIRAAPDLFGTRARTGTELASPILGARWAPPAGGLQPTRSTMPGVSPAPLTPGVAPIHEAPVLFGTRTRISTRIGAATQPTDRPHLFRTTAGVAPCPTLTRLAHSPTGGRPW